MKLWLMLTNILPVFSQMLIGNEKDSHGCVTDGGYQWCESLDKCIRPWMEPCIPKNCKSWYDGCNRCHVNNDGSLLGCTKMMCFTKSEPNCVSYYRDDELKLNDICYQFCEDGSKPTINLKSKCPRYTLCATTYGGMSFDTCNKPLKCIAGN